MFLCVCLLTAYSPQFCWNVVKNFRQVSSFPKIEMVKFLRLKVNGQGQGEKNHVFSVCLFVCEQPIADSFAGMSFKISDKFRLCLE